MLLASVAVQNMWGNFSFGISLQILSSLHLQHQSYSIYAVQDCGSQVTQMIKRNLEDFVHC